MAQNHKAEPAAASGSWEKETPDYGKQKTSLRQTSGNSESRWRKGRGAGLVSLIRTRVRPPESCILHFIISIKQQQETSSGESKGLNSP